MRLSRDIFKGALAGIFCLVAGAAVAQDETAPEPPPMQVLISVADQKLALLRDGGLIAKYPISTSMFGVGDSWGSYRTPLGKLKVYDKIGDDLSPGAVIRHRSATGEVIAANAPGRDPIVTRVIWLEGTEEQNANARARGIYIHGTPEEKTIGTPRSWGCIRMRSVDVIAVYNQLPVGTEVDITQDHLPHLHKYKPPPPVAPAPTEPAIAQQAPSGLLAGVLSKKNVKQAAAQPAPPAPAVAADKPASGPVAKTASKNDAKLASVQPPPPAPADSEKHKSGLLVHLLGKKDVKQAAAQPPQQPLPPVAEKTKPEKTVSHAASVAASRESDSDRTVKATGSGDTDALRAMKGSVLLAGLPPPAPKSQTVAEQSTQTTTK